MDDGFISPVKRDQRDKPLEEQKRRSDYPLIDSDMMFRFIVCHICEHCDVLTELLHQPVDKGGLMPEYQYKFVRSCFACDLEWISWEVTKKMVQLLSVSDLIAVDDVLWRYSGANDLGVFIPRKPAKFGVYADAMASLLLQTGLPVYIGFVFHETVSNKLAPWVSCLKLVDHVL